VDKKGRGKKQERKRRKGIAKMRSTRNKSRRRRREMYEV
jgi:hypothetical protein